MTGPDIPPVQLALLVVQSAVFAAFAYFAFRTLFRLRRHALSVKRPHTGLGSELFERQRADLVSFRNFVSTPEFRTERRRLAAIVVLMIALIGAQIALTPKHAPQPQPPAPDSQPIP